MQQRIKVGQKTNKRDSRPVQAPFQVKGVKAAQVAAIILDELSRKYPEDCNFLDAVRLLNEGQVYLAYISVQERTLRTAVSGAQAVWVHAQANAALKKLVDREYDRWASTKSVWFSTERRCELLNRKFAMISGRLMRGLTPTRHEDRNLSLQRFSEALAFALGDTFPMERVCEEAYYGPGSSVSVRGKEVHYVRKVEAFECVPLARELAVEALRHDRAVWSQVGMDPLYATNPDAIEGFRRVVRELLVNTGVPVDRLMFIHKSIESLRSIGAQPTCSGMVQLGVHNVGVEILKSLKIDLKDQGMNQKAAWLGSRDWRLDNPLCTLDKSNASNLVALGLIQAFFPPAWAENLCRLRTPQYEAPKELGGGIHNYHMYAGMGNGTTFFVETLIFWAIAYASSFYKDPGSFVEKGEYFVYGDDVVLRRDHAKRYMSLATYLGFQFNKKKTFLEGPFRESCGADYWDGRNVRPAYPSSNEGSEFMSDLDIIGVHNTLADNELFPLDGACSRIRQLWKSNIFPIVPTDPQGNLGFRPVGSIPYYDIVRNRDRIPALSDAWQRPRTYHVRVEAKTSSLQISDPWTQLAVALLKARQSWKETGNWELSVRDVVHTRVIPEADLKKKDLVQMLGNQLARLAAYKSTTWWKPSRGL